MTLRKFARRNAFATTVTAAILAVISFPQASYADHGGGWPTGVYAHRWALNTGATPLLQHVRYFFDDGVPTEIRPYVVNAEAAWSSITGSRFRYVAAGQTNDDRWIDGTCNLYGDVVVSYGDLINAGWDTNYAETAACTLQDGQMHSARIRISNDFRQSSNPFGADFYFGTGTLPNDRKDVRGTIMHEFGHATGRTGDAQDMGHFNQGDRACPGTATAPGIGYATLCVGLGPGKTAWRSLEEHDQSPVRTQYPQ